MKEFLEIRIMRQRRIEKHGHLLMFKYCVIDRYVHTEPATAMRLGIEMAAKIHPGAWPVLRRVETEFKLWAK